MNSKTYYEYRGSPLRCLGYNERERHARSTIGLIVEDHRAGKKTRIANFSITEYCERFEGYLLVALVEWEQRRPGVVWRAIESGNMTPDSLIIIDGDQAKDQGLFEQPE
jgi:hypothetical protein